MSSSRSFASLSATLLARKGGARPAMRPQLGPNGQPVTPAQLNDLGWNDMGSAAPTPIVPAAANTDSVVAFDPPPASEPLLARKPVSAEVVRLVRGTPAQPTADLASVGGRTVVKRTRSAAFTLRLDPDRHFNLRVACVQTGRSAQSLVTEAIDRFLGDQPARDSLADTAGKQRIA